MANYAHPEMLVSTDWAASHASDANVRVAEVDVDTKAYDEGHVPGAIAWAWNTQLCDTVRRDILSKEQFEQLMSASGVMPETTVVIYGDNNNWFAAWALWQMKVYGHKDVRLMNGGRKKWTAEGRELTRQVPAVAKATHRAMESNMSLRAFLPEVQRALETTSHALVDVRSPDEFTGKVLSPPGRRPHPWREEHSLGNGLQGGRQLQIGGRARGALSEQRNHCGQANDSLLPYRGTL